MPNSGAERWQQIVDNTAALVAEMDSGLVPAVEAAFGRESWSATNTEVRNRLAIARRNHRRLLPA
jgi:hypothetical protein